MEDAPSNTSSSDDNDSDLSSRRGDANSVNSKDHILSTPTMTTTAGGLRRTMSITDKFELKSERAKQAEYVLKSRAYEWLLLLVSVAYLTNLIVCSHFEDKYFHMTTDL